jgi:hypothetical protein
MGYQDPATDPVGGAQRPAGGDDASPANSTRLLDVGRLADPECFLQRQWIPLGRLRERVFDRGKIETMKTDQNDYVGHAGISRSFWREVLLSRFH